jgi:hypothetical protein
VNIAITHLEGHIGIVYVIAEKKKQSPEMSLGLANANRADALA